MKAIDPVCGMEVDTAQTSFKASHEGRAYHFCTRLCMVLFQQTPNDYLVKHEKRENGNEKI